mmetsp:Transcript_127553/g.369253  ORF Transcript_127553/g.369253 Transcript_127553/m.369253 type:complete len:1783 (-) Transcript_127553:44-5392(-)
MALIFYDIASHSFVFFSKFAFAVLGDRDSIKCLSGINDFTTSRFCSVLSIVQTEIIMQAPQPPPMQSQTGGQQQQSMSAPAPGPPQVQHAQYAPQHQHQNSSYQQQHGAPAPPPAHAQPPAGQQYPAQGLNGGWQSDQDYNERRKMIAKIVHLLKQRKPNAPQDWLKKLPQMAKRLEESLYRSAKSFEEYNDASTLKQRLQQLAHNIGMKTKRMQQAQMQQRAQQQQQQQLHAQAKQAQYRATQPQQQQPIAPHHHQQQQQQPVQPRPPPQQNYQPVPQHQQQHQHQQPMHQPPQMHQQQPGQRIVNVADINPIMSGGQQQQSYQPAPAPAPVQPAPVPPQPQQYQYQPQQPQQGGPVPAPAPMQAPAPAGSAPTNGARSRQVSDRQQVLRHQQQRLLLLRHAAKCQHEDGRCPVTPHCAGMKRLWKHIAECKDQKCLVPHCVSSRYVLSHYHRCKDVRCPVCGPVREAIHRSHEKQKQMQALKQQHQRAVQQSQSQPVAPQPVQQPPAPQPMQPLQPSAPLQPPNKRQRTSPGMMPAQPPYAAPGAPPIQPLGQPSMHQPQAAPPGHQQPRPGYPYGQQPPGVKPAAPGSAPITVQTAPGVAFQNGQMITPKYTGPKPQEDHTLINCFTIEQIETHIASLNKGLQLAPQRLKSKCLEVLKVLQSHQHGWVFNSPVDPVELGLPDYFEVIKKPMDLGTIRKKLDNGVYHSLEEFEGHVNLTFDNAMLYNPEGSVVYNMAKEMKDKFAQDYDVMMKQVMAEEDQKRRNGEACLLCGCEKLLFEPPVFYCNGLNCPSKRIRRNSYYYVGGNNQYHWCHQCFQELKDGRTIELGDITIRKEQLTKKKNDETHEESWVQCDRCERWIHQICALFNTRQNKDQRSEYACPRCTIEERKKKGQREGTSSTPMAEDLQRTKLSEYLENHVRDKMNEHLDQEAKKKATSEGISMEEATKEVEMGGTITIRQVTSMDKKLEVRERMKKRYAFKNYPDEFSYRCKCIVVFQNLDGVDVILFGLYVYEHDEKNPAPNKRAVYVSYLDSVHYMRPRNMRTFIYHEILISYLDYVRRRGFSTAHIWACPPLKGDDYILYAKPEDQKTPKDDRLRQWYIDMLVECQRRGIVGKVTNMYDLYFSNKENDATVVPYMDGDYFPAEVENIIKDIEEGKTGKKGSQQGKKKKNDKKQKKKSGSRGGTRSTGLDEDALKASGIMTPGKDQKSLEEGGRDYVMVKLGETIQPMKESFIVAYLAWSGAREQDMVVPKEIQEYREKHGIEPLYPPNKDANPTETKEEQDPPKQPDSESKPDEKAADEPKNPEKDQENASEANPPATASEEEKPAEKDDSDMKIESAEEKKDDSPKQDSEHGNETPKTEENPAPQGTEQTPAAAATSNENKDESKTTETTADAAGSQSNSDADAMEVDSKEKPSESDEQKDSSKPASGEQEEEAKPSEPAKPENAGSTSPTENAASPAGPPAASIPDAVPTSSAPAPDVSAPAEDKPSIKVVPMEQRAGKFAAMARKRGREDPPEETPSKEGEEEKKDEKEEEEVPAVYVTDSKGRRVKVIDDDAEELDCEFLNNRQAFLNLCQGNHYQFDQLRRAKHSSMMVLWHLHNRDAPKFVQQCTTCSREILTGYRFHCPTCADFDQCQECVQNPNTPRHPHQLKPIPVSGQQTELTEAQRKERQRSIQLHMTLLLHAATCNSPKCPSANCTKMKGLLKHGAQCQQKATGGCNVCKRIWALLQIHARQCKASSCPVPNCMAIRERVRQLKKQQQAMDDRRRQEMNRVYRR